VKCSSYENRLSLRFMRHENKVHPFLRTPCLGDLHKGMSSRRRSSSRAFLCMSLRGGGGKEKMFPKDGFQSQARGGAPGSQSQHPPDDSIHVKRLPGIGARGYWKENAYGGEEEEQDYRGGVVLAGPPTDGKKLNTSKVAMWISYVSCLQHGVC
jgi:hypothetical protein